MGVGVILSQKFEIVFFLLACVVLEFIQACLECSRGPCDALDGWRAPRLALPKPKRRAAKPKKAEHLRGDSARARGSTLYFTRIAAAPRGSGRTRAPGYSAPRSGRLQEWSAAARARATLTRWRRS